MRRRIISCPAKGGQGCEWKREANEKWEANDWPEERHGPPVGNQHDCDGRNDPGQNSDDTTEPQPPVEGNEVAERQMREKDRRTSCVPAKCSLRACWCRVGPDPIADHPRDDPSGDGMKVNHGTTQIPTNRVAVDEMGPAPARNAGPGPRPSAHLPE
jgi:hypothetical protein